MSKLHSKYSPQIVGISQLQSKCLICQGADISRHCRLDNADKHLQLELQVVELLESITTGKQRKANSGGGTMVHHYELANYRMSSALKLS